MADTRWDVPQTEEGLQTLLSRLKESRESGDDAAVGRGLLALAHQVKWVRSDNHEPPFLRAGTLISEAVEAFRRCGDEKGLLQALRQPSMFLGPEERKHWLDEAMQIAERLGDEIEIARTVEAQARMSALSNPESAAAGYQKALEVYRRRNNKHGQARCLFGLAIRLDCNENKFEMACEAADLYRETGDLNMSSKMAVIAIMNGEGRLSYSAMEPIIRQGLIDAQAGEKHSMESIFYGHLAKLHTEKSEPEEAAKYLRWKQEIEESDGRTPKERQKDDVDMTKMLIAMAQASGNTESVRLFSDELKRLKKLRVK